MRARFEDGGVRSQKGVTREKWGRGTGQRLNHGER